ncbi:MAG: hypothetical protein NTV05_02265 [Acidobacteria bacterium]|nr:hypothetical protein [Acidobacteriota bacterium]
MAIATTGPDGPHLAATWGDYVRALGVPDNVILIPAGGLQTTEATRFVRFLILLGHDVDIEDSRDLS